MINQARTLVLNRDGSARPAPSFFLEEYVDPQYVAVKLPQYLRNIQNILIGNGSDNAFANFRLWQLFRTIHSTELESYVYALDPRVTYLNDRSVVSNSSLNSSVPLSPASTDNEVFFIGDLSASNATPRLEYSWVATVEDATHLKTVCTQTKQENLTEVSFTDGLSDLIPLAGQRNFSIRIKAAGSLPIDGQWYLTSFVKPQLDVTGLLEPLSRLGDETLSQLFGTREPYKTFQEIWNKHVYYQYRLSAFVLAYVYRTNEVLHGQ